jgi:putative DNA primase/helicase
VRYRYATGRSPDDVEIAEIPGWLLTLLRKSPSDSGHSTETSSPQSRAPALYGTAALQFEADAVRDAPKGTRNDRLNTAAFSMGQLVGAGEIGRAEVEGALSETALAAGLEADEIHATIESGLAGGLEHPRRRDREGGQPPQINDLLLTELAKLGETDTDNAQRLVQRYGDRLQFIPERKEWFAFDGRIWHEDSAKQRILFTQASAGLIASEANVLDDDQRGDRRSWSKQSLGAGAIRRALEMAQPHATRPITDFDNRPWLLNVKNGTLDLQTGKLRAFDPADHLTRLAGTVYDKDAKYPLFSNPLPWAALSGGR